MVCNYPHWETKQHTRQIMNANPNKRPDQQQSLARHMICSAICYSPCGPLAGSLCHPTPYATYYATYATMPPGPGTHSLAPQAEKKQGSNIWMRLPHMQICNRPLSIADTSSQSMRLKPILRMCCLSSNVQRFLMVQRPVKKANFLVVSDCLTLVMIDFT